MTTAFVTSLEAGPVNLDGMDKSDLYVFITATRNLRRAAKRMFPNQKLGVLQVIRDLNNYAWTKTMAMECRESGDCRRAGSYEGICERIYNSLPVYARW